MASRKTREGKGKAYGGRGGPGCLSFILLALFILAAIAATVAIFFRINRIEVRGNERYTPDEVRSASGIEQGDNLLLFNKFGAISSIFSQLPYVDEIRMSRDFPDTLAIDITECVASAYFYDGRSYWLISNKGKILEQRSEQAEGKLIEILGADLIGPEIGKKAILGAKPSGGEETDAGQTEAAKTDGIQTDATQTDAIRESAMSDTLSAIIDAGIEGNVKSLDVGKVYDIEFRYLDRFQVRLGMPEDLDYKMNFLKEEIVSKLESNDRGTIDLSELIEKGIGRFIPE